MNKLGILLLMAASATALVVGCDGETESASGTSNTSSSSSTSTSTSSSSSSSGGSDLGNMPAAYGKQTDRFGRPAINTALNKTFEKDAAAAGIGKDAWNANGDPANWTKDHQAEVAKNLAIIDSLDMDCGNQLLADKTDPPIATRYAGLAAVLADDRQWLNSAGAMCTTYLAVEANATGLLANADCGGRGLSYDVIDASYSGLAIGALSGVGDGIDAPAYSKGTAFPYLAAPLP